MCVELVANAQSTTEGLRHEFSNRVSIADFAIGGDALGEQLSGEIDGDELFDSLDQLRGQFNLLALQLENLIELGSHELPHPGQ